MSQLFHKHPQEAEKCCKGCQFRREYLFCMIIEYDEEENCPCVNCLVKVICQDQGKCRLRMKFTNTSTYDKKKGTLGRRYTMIYEPDTKEKDRERIQNDTIK